MSQLLGLLGSWMITQLPRMEKTWLSCKSLLNSAFNDVSDKTAVSLQKRQLVGKDTFEENTYPEMTCCVRGSY